MSGPRQISLVDVCRRLHIDAGELADIFRREAARLLREYASEVESGVDTTLSYVWLVDEVRERLVNVRELERSWEREHPVEPFDQERGNEAASGATEATPLHRDTAVAADTEGSR